MVPIPYNGTDPPLTVAIGMDELGDNETKQGKWCDILLVTLESMIHLSEDIFSDDVPWDCVTMLT